MSMFKVNVVARNPKREELATVPLEALVDTGSELTWLPAEVLKGAGITPRRKRAFSTATQQRIEREIGFAIISAEGFETIDEVVFAQPGDMTLLGVRTLEGFGVMVDNLGHRLVAVATIVAVVPRQQSRRRINLAKIRCLGRPINRGQCGRLRRRRREHALPCDLPTQVQGNRMFRQFGAC